LFFGSGHECEPIYRRNCDPLDHGHLARSFETLWFDSIDLVVCMDRGHQQTLASLARGRARDDRFLDRLVMLRAFDPMAGGAVDVPDPYYGDELEFEACLDLVEAGCRGLTQHLAGRDWSGPAFTRS